MGIEIERKFLVLNSNWKRYIEGSQTIKQGYLNSSIDRTVRVRLYGEKAFITVKGKSKNITRQEFEYEIPYNDALHLLALCEKPLIEKVRHSVNFDNNNWEIDVFEGNNKGLTIAELELENEGQLFNYPDWLGEEVSDDARYFNSSLVKLPFCNW